MISTAISGINRQNIVSDMGVYSDYDIISVIDIFSNNYINSDSDNNSGMNTNIDNDISDYIIKVIVIML